MKLLRRPISAPDRSPDRLYDISMDFLSLSPRPVPPRETTPVPKNEEKQLFSQANLHIVENCQ